MSSESEIWGQLSRLYATIRSRKGVDPAQSYTAKLMAGGTAKIAKKLGEEAVETALAAASGDRDGVIGESADLLYHLLVLWADQEIAPEEVMKRLGQRQGQSGIAEKAQRGHDRN